MLIKERLYSWLMVGGSLLLKVKILNDDGRLKCSRFPRISRPQR
jgi:hypothetical protein